MRIFVRPRPAIVGALALAFAVCGSASAQDVGVETIKTPRGETVRYALISPQGAEIAIMLLAGGHGAIGLKEGGGVSWGRGNTLVRTHKGFAAKGLIAALIDAPSDQPKRMPLTFRLSDAHAQDLAAIAADLRAKGAKTVWLAGVSRGTVSAAYAMLAEPKAFDGVALIAPLTVFKKKWAAARRYPKGILDLPLGRMTAPALVMGHLEDGCVVSPPEGVPAVARALKKSARVSSALLKGGGGDGDPCQGRSFHGLWGLDSEVVSTVIDFIAAAPR